MANYLLNCSWDHYGVVIRSYCIQFLLALDQNVSVFGPYRFSTMFPNALILTLLNNISILDSSSSNAPLISMKTITYSDKANWDLQHRIKIKIIVIYSSQSCEQHDFPLGMDICTVSVWFPLGLCCLSFEPLVFILLLCFTACAGNFFRDIYVQRCLAFSKEFKFTIYATALLPVTGPMRTCCINVQQWTQVRRTNFLNHTFLWKKWLCSGRKWIFYCYSPTLKSDY